METPIPFLRTGEEPRRLLVLFATGFRRYPCMLTLIPQHDPHILPVQESDVSPLSSVEVHVPPLWSHHRSAYAFAPSVRGLICPETCLQALCLRQSPANRFFCTRYLCKQVQAVRSGIPFSSPSSLSQTHTARLSHVLLHTIWTLTRSRRPLFLWLPVYATLVLVHLRYRAEE